MSTRAQAVLDEAIERCRSEDAELGAESCVWRSGPEIYGIRAGNPRVAPAEAGDAAGV